MRCCCWYSKKIKFIRTANRIFIEKQNENKKKQPPTNTNLYVRCVLVQKPIHRRRHMMIFICWINKEIYRLQNETRAARIYALQRASNVH